MSGQVTPPPDAPQGSPSERFVNRLLLRMLKEAVGELELGRNADYVLMEDGRAVDLGYAQVESELLRRLGRSDSDAVVVEGMLEVERGPHRHLLLCRIERGRGFRVRPRFMLPR